MAKKYKARRNTSGNLVMIQEENGDIELVQVDVGVVLDSMQTYRLYQFLQSRYAQ